MTLKRKILLLIPIAIIAGHIIYTWVVILFVSHRSTWRHYIGLILFIALTYILKKSYKQAAVATGIYLIIGTLNLLTITPGVVREFSFYINSFGISLPVFEPRLFLIFLIYFFLNFDTLVDIRLDYIEAKELRKKQ